MSFRHGGDIVGEKLAERGITHIFTLCGGHISPILVGAKKNGVQVVDVRDEATSVFAADAYARMTGLPGVAAVTAGPGVTNTVTAVKNAQMAQSPVVIFGGATPTILRGRGALQDIDQMTLMEPLTKWTTRITTVKALGPAVQKAFDIAQEGVPGPVFIEVPVDLLYPEEIVKEWYIKESGVENASGLPAKALGLYLKGHLARQFHQPHIEVDLELPQPSFSFQKDAEDEVERAAEAVRKAKRPVLVLGSQTLVNMTDERANELAESITALGIPTFLGGMSRGLLGADSDIQFRHKRTNALKEADVVIIAGFPFDFRLGYGRKISSKATLIAANLSSVDLRKNRRPDIGLLQHPGEFLIELSKRTDGRKDSWDSWFGKLRDREEARDAEIEEQAKDTNDEGLVNPLDFFLRLEEKLDDDSVLIVDGGDFVATASYILRPRKPLSWLDPGVFGTLGVGGGFAVGAASVRPDDEIWLLYGDGSSGYSIAEFDTYIRMGFAPIAVIGTDGAWAQIAREQVEILGDDVATTLLRSDYHTVAEGYGGKGILVTSPDEIDGAIAEAKKLAKAGTPVCINVHIAKSDFRKGSISM